jgi:hypothetical protein
MDVPVVRDLMVCPLHLPPPLSGQRGTVTMYGMYLDGGFHGNTTCTTPQCFYMYVVPVSVLCHLCVISDKDGYVGPKSITTIYGKIR